MRFSCCSRFGYLDREMAAKRFLSGDPRQRCAQVQGLQRVLCIGFLCLLRDLLKGLVSNTSDNEGRRALKILTDNTNNRGCVIVD